MAKETTTLYVIGGAVVLAIAALLFLRPKAAYAQPGAPAPGLPGPGVPAPPAVGEFPIQSSIEVPEPILVEYGDIEFFVKKRTAAEAPSTSFGPATWQGFDREGLRVGTTWYHLGWIGQWNPPAVMGPQGQGVLWVPADGPLKDFR